MYKVKLIYEFDISEETIENMRKEYSEDMDEEYSAREYMDILCDEYTADDFDCICKDCEWKASWTRTDD